MLADHGYPAIWTPAGGAPAPAIVAIFDADYVSVDDGNEDVEISSVGPTLFALTVDVVSVEQGDGFTTEAPHADAAGYKVIDLQHASSDGVYTRLFLHRVI